MIATGSFSCAADFCGTANCELRGDCDRTCGLCAEDGGDDNGDGGHHRRRQLSADLRRILQMSFSVCDPSTFSQQAEAVDLACCGTDGGSCANGTPDECDARCAIVYTDFYERCESLLASISASPAQIQAYENLYATCERGIPTEPLLQTIAACAFSPDLCGGVCGLHGDCDGTADEHRCVCFDGYTGPACDTPPAETHSDLEVLLELKVRYVHSHDGGVLPTRSFLFCSRVCVLIGSFFIHARVQAALEDPDGCLATWDPTTHPCESWHGVRCGGCEPGAEPLMFKNHDYLGCPMDPQHPNRVTSIFRSGFFTESCRSLRGSLPDSIAHLSRLQVLGLWRTDIEGTIPPTVGELRHLRYVNLRNTRIEGTVPDTVGGLGELRYLSLSSTSIEGTIPRTVGGLRLLQKLSLHDTDLDGSVPAVLSELPSLLFLNLQHTLVNGAQCEAFCYAHNSTISELCRCPDPLDDHRHHHRGHG
eukprot:SAG31_NODE_3225_length_4519_cov_2.363122_5_plen_477_part_00